MAIALNLTVPLKQDPQSQETLKQLATSFTETIQDPLDKALAASRIVHFARFVVIEENQRGRYLQVLTEFDGHPMDYTEFFRTTLGPVFKSIFALAEGAPPWEELNTPDGFLEYMQGLNLKSLGTSSDPNDDRGYLFSAVGDKTVRELRPDPPNASGHVRPPYLDRVKAGETVEVTECGQPVALLAPPHPRTSARQRLVASGRLIPAARPFEVPRRVPARLGAPDTGAALDELREDRA